MAEVARLYYVRDLTQQDIAERLGVSRFKVVRLLAQARSEGVVRFEIDEPMRVDDRLSLALEERYGLATALVVDDVATAAASLLPRLLRPGDSLGVAWGETLAAIERRLAPPGPGVPVVQVCGAIEGLAPADGLHPIQQAFLENAALQCGICTPGFIMSSKALLASNPNPSEHDIRFYLAGNLCRCTGYDKIVRAVQQSAEMLQKESV